MTWQQLLRVLSDLVERDLVSGPERLLISDFFALVEAHFPLIGPVQVLLVKFLMIGRFFLPVL